MRVYVVLLSIKANKPTCIFLDWSHSAIAGRGISLTVFSYFFEATEIKFAIASMTSMEESWISWLCDMEPDDHSFMNQSDTNVDHASLASHHDVLQEENPQSSMSNCSVAESNLERPSKLRKTEEQLSQKTASSPCSYILSFDKSNEAPIKVEAASKPGSKVVNSGSTLPSKNEARRVTQESKKRSRSHYHGQDHIIAERMRREKISQHFIALSALIPDLKKMDKATVLVDAIKYVKQLKERVKVLEEEQSKKKSVESVVLVKKSQVSAADEDVSDTSSNSSEFGNSDDPSKANMSLPEVEARVSKKNVLIRIHCEKEKVALVNIFREIEKLHLSVTNCSAFSFGSSVLHITVIAQMEDEFNMSVKELARNLRVGLKQYMCSA